VKHSGAIKRSTLLKVEVENEIIPSSRDSTKECTIHEVTNLFLQAPLPYFSITRTFEP